MLCTKTDELEKLSADLGFQKTFFADDVVLLEGDTKKQLIRDAMMAKRKKKIVIYAAATEESLRFVLEKVPVDIVFGMEKIHPKDSMHYVRGGLDQVLCKIAREKGKTIGFAFLDVLESSSRGKLLARMMLNIKLCKKYGVPMIFSNFGKVKFQMRSKKDLEIMWGILS